MTLFIYDEKLPVSASTMRQKEKRSCSSRRFVLEMLPAAGKVWGRGWRNYFLTFRSLQEQTEMHDKNDERGCRTERSVALEKLMFIYRFSEASGGAQVCFGELSPPCSSPTILIMVQIDHLLHHCKKPQLVVPIKASPTSNV